MRHGEGLKGVEHWSSSQALTYQCSFPFQQKWLSIPTHNNQEVGTYLGKLLQRAVFGAGEAYIVVNVCRPPSRDLHASESIPFYRAYKRPHFVLLSSLAFYFDGKIKSTHAIHQ